MRLIGPSDHYSVTKHKILGKLLMLANVRPHMIPKGGAFVMEGVKVFLSIVRGPAWNVS